MTAKLYIVHDETKFRHYLGAFDDWRDAQDAGEQWFVDAGYEIDESAADDDPEDA